MRTHFEITFEICVALLFPTQEPLFFAGSLIKLVYFSSNSSCTLDDNGMRVIEEKQKDSNGDVNYHFLHGRLQFVKFETAKIDECIKFLSSRQLNCNGTCPW